MRAAKNRNILPDNLHFIRSDVPVNLTVNDIQWLIDNNVLTIIDLREEKERAAKPCPLSENNCFTYLCMPVTGGNTIPETASRVSESYLKMADSRMSEIISTILSAETNVMYFCNAGKDRTGVVSALLLKKLGAKENVIVEDYMMSKENLMDMLTAYVHEHPEVDIEIIIPHEDNILKVLMAVENM